MAAPVRAPVLPALFASLVLILQRVRFAALLGIGLGIGLAAAGNAAALTYADAVAAFDAVLADHVTDGSVDYDAIASDRRFSDFIDWLADAAPETLADDTERLAFWINAYNALSIKGILDGGSPGSLFGRARFFKSKRHEIAGRELTLDQIEKDIIIPYGEPRIHFAIVCSSASCPELKSAAYAPGRLDTQLEGATRDFLNDRDKNYYDPDANRLYLSKIFDWFEADFVAAAGSLAAYVGPYLDDPAQREAVSTGSPTIRFLRYDWSLNGSFKGR